MLTDRARGIIGTNDPPDTENTLHAASDTPAARQSLIERMLGAARLDIATYEEVEHDSTATGQAAMVVGIVAICAAIGAAREGGALGGLLSAYIGWLTWSAVTYLIGDKLLGGTATWGELLRTLGFAQSPGVLYILAFIPGFGWLIRLVVALWILVAGVIAIRQALDFSTGRAILTGVLGFLAYALVAAVFAFLGLLGNLMT